MDSMLVEHVAQEGNAAQPVWTLRLPNLLAHLRRQREALRRAALEMKPPAAPSVIFGETCHERSEADHRRS
jgi:hypothetical protein